MKWNKKWLPAAIFALLLVGVVALAQFGGVTGTDRRVADDISVYEGYSADPLKKKGKKGKLLKCKGGHAGGADAAGNFYFGCNKSIQVVSPKGKRISKATKKALAEQEGRGKFAPRFTVKSDVAPHPSGNEIYYIVTSSKLKTHARPNCSEEDPGAMGEVHRLTKKGKKWVRDTAFAIPTWEVDGVGCGDGGTKAWWRNSYVAVDGKGRVFTTKNEFVWVYETANGGATQIPNWEKDGDFQLPGTIGSYADGAATFMGVAVADDGKGGTTVYVAAQSPMGEIWRYDELEPGKWTRNVGATISTTDGTNKLSSPYDVGVDASGNVYVANTSAAEIWRYSATDPSTGVRIAKSPKYEATGTKLNKVRGPFHGIAVNGKGAIVIPGLSLILTPGDGTTTSGPDKIDELTCNVRVKTFFDGKKAEMNGCIGTSGPDDATAPDGNGYIMKGLGGADELNGNSGDDVLIGGKDNDLLDGKGGHDAIAGGTGNDQLKGDTGNDFLLGRGDNDSIDGGPGSDTIYGGGGKDTINAKDGEVDVIAYAKGDKITCDKQDKLMVKNPKKPGKRVKKLPCGDKKNLIKFETPSDVLGLVKESKKDDPADKDDEKAEK